MDTGTRNAVGIDGELIDGAYRLLGASDREPLQSDRALRTAEVFDYLLALAGSRVYGYGIGLDVAHWMRDLTIGELQHLAANGRCYTEQGGRYYRVRYQAGKKFSLQLLDGFPLGRRPKTIASVTVSDLMRWHRRPFVAVAEEWKVGTARNREFVGAMKQVRSDFSKTDAPGVAEYNRIECEMIAELAADMTESLYALGYSIPHPFTPGSVASAFMTKRCWGVRGHYADPPEPAREAVSTAFFGGRQQTFRFGRFRDGARHYDIRSAYGWALSQLPSLRGRWEQMPEDNRYNSGTPPHNYGLRHVEWDFDEGSHRILPFPVRRSDGRVGYPACGSGWYWTPLIAAVELMYPGEIRITEGWDYVPDDPEARPFTALMANLYETRGMMQGPDAPIAPLVKLLITSSWGLLCKKQTAWAGLATSFVDAKLLLEMFQHPDNIISCCVDGFWSTAEHYVAVGDGMGEWRSEITKDLMLINPSCYWSLRDGGWSASTSGIPNGLEILPEVLQEWDEQGMRGLVTSTRRAPDGIAKCARLADWSTLGQFQEHEIRVALNPGWKHAGHTCPTLPSCTKDWSYWLNYWPPCGKHISHPYKHGDLSLQEATSGTEWAEVLK